MQLRKASAYIIASLKPGFWTAISRDDFIDRVNFLIVLIQDSIQLDFESSWEDLIREGNSAHDTDLQFSFL